AWRLRVPLILTPPSRRPDDPTIVPHDAGGEAVREGARPRLRPTSLEVDAPPEEVPSQRPTPPWSTSQAIRPYPVCPGWSPAERARSDSHCSCPIRPPTVST